MTTFLTDDQIELRVQYAMDRLDRKFMNGGLTQAQYDKEVGTLDKWAIQQYDAQKLAAR